MEQKILWDLYCFQCSLQFEKKSIYDLHLSIIHNYKSRREIVIKSEPEGIELLPTLSDIQPTPKEEQGKKQFNCDFCEKSFKTKKTNNIHTVSVHEGMKPFQCKSCDYKSSQKGGLYQHIASVHEAKNPFQCQFCDKYFTAKQKLVIHIASVHEGKKPFKCETYDYSASQKGP